MVHKTIRLDEIIDFNPKRTITKGKAAPFIEMAALPVDCRDISGIDEKEFKSGGSKFQNGDTLFARITPCLENGKTAKVSGLGDGEFGFGSTEFIVMAAKKPEYDEEYIYYLARLPEFRSYAQSRMEGTSGRQRVGWQSLAEFEYPFPDKEVRREVGKILKNFDDKIAVNTQINQTLEAMAQALFKSWFIDFDPVKAKIEAREAGASDDEVRLAAMEVISGKNAEELTKFETDKPEKYKQLASTADLFPETLVESELGLIPEGWEVGRLEDTLELAYGKGLKKTDRIDGDVSVYGSGGVTGTHNIALVEGPGIIVGRKGTVGSLYWEDSAFYPIDTVFYANPKSYFPLSYLYYLLKTLNLNDMNTDAAVPGLNRNNAYRLEIVKASKDIVDTFGLSVSLFRNKIKSLNKESEQLKNTRDTLLPKLLSGEIDFSNSIKETK